MLCPEIWNFDPPPSSAHYSLMRESRKIRNVIANQYFNHFVSITIPNTMQFPQNLRNILSEDSEYYYVHNFYAFETVNVEFLDFFVRKGQLTLLSVETNLDEDDCLAITPIGKLILLLRRETYQELGIEGKPSSFSNKLADKYVVTLNLTEDFFQPGKKNYEHVLERLKHLKGLCFNVILAWEPHENNICPSSIALYITNKGYSVKTCDIKLKQRQEYNVAVPIFQDECDGEVLTEWLGAFNLQCEIPQKANGYITTYQNPENHIVFGQVMYLEAIGLFTTMRLQKLLEELLNYVNILSPSAWIGFHVNGFEDSVVNIGNQENFYYSSGDYSYTVFFRKEGSPLLCTYVSSTRRPNTKTKKRKNRN